MKKYALPIIVILLIAGGVYYKYYQTQHPEQYKVEETKTEIAKPATTGSSTDSPTATTTSSTTLNITPEVPIAGIKKGVIEVGASGFNRFVVSMDKNKNWEMIDKQFDKSKMFEGFNNLDDVMKKLDIYLDEIFRLGVSGSNVHFVMSSGALKNPKTEDIAKGIAKKGFVVNRVDAAQEGKFALKAALPKAYKQNSFVVDMGSGNTKISWYDVSGNLKSLECPGAKYYQIPKTDADVAAEIKAAASQVPQNLRQNCFIIGGVPSDLAKLDGEHGRYLQLKNPDDYSAGKDEKLKAGLNIYRSIVEATGTNTFIFDWDANFTIGFLMSLN